MARNGSGTYNRAVSPYTAGTTITAATVNQEMDDIATALTQSLSRDGQSPPTANLPMGNFRITGLANAIASTDAAPLGQVVAKAGDTMAGAFGVVAGTAAAPGLFVSGDTNTGAFFPSADVLALSTGGSERLRIDASGNVGIGTSSPSKKLEVFSSANSLQIGSIVRNDQAGIGVAAIGFNVSSSAAVETTSTKAGIGLVREAAFGGGPLCFYNNNSGASGDFTTADEKMRIDSTGNVGIGTSAPLQRLSAVNTSITGGAPASSGSAADPNAVARFGAGSAVLDVGTTAAGAMWLQARAAANYATNYALSLNPNGGGVDIAGDLRFNSGYGSVATAYGVRAWVNFNGTGTVAIRASGGVTSITDNGTGDYTVNLNFTMPDANYGFAINGVAGTSSFVGDVPSGGMTTTSFRINTRRVDTRALEDFSIVSVTLVR